eukprot:4829708-Ditylum_brightwellii.AAC.1
MYVPGHWMPKDWDIPNVVCYHLGKFMKYMVTLLLRHHSKNNLLRHHCRVLRHLCQQQEFLVMNYDKNMGTALIKKDIYVDRALSEHLCNRTTYQQLNATQAR